MPKIPKLVFSNMYILLWFLKIKGIFLGHMYGTVLCSSVHFFLNMSMIMMIFIVAKSTLSHFLIRRLGSRRWAFTWHLCIMVIMVRLRTIALCALSKQEPDGCSMHSHTHQRRDTSKSIKIWSWLAKIQFAVTCW